MEDSTPKSYHSDPNLYLYTSLTAGSSHIITATSRLETILKANKIAFLALDVATDEKARMLWGRRAGKRKLPGLVKMGVVVAVCSSPFYVHRLPRFNSCVGSRPSRGMERIWGNKREPRRWVSSRPTFSYPICAEYPFKAPKICRRRF